MSFERAREHLTEAGMEDRLLSLDSSIATVEQAAAAIGCDPGMIAKSLTFLREGEPIMILVEGRARVDNKKYRNTFQCKAKMIPAQQVEELVGHAVGGVCPFGVNENVSVYLDVSLRQHDTVYPAAGDEHSAVCLSISDLERCSGYIDWVDVCK